MFSDPKNLIPGSLTFCSTIEIFRKYSNKKCLSNFPVIMPYLRHIVEQPIERFYCSLLVSLKVRIHMMYVIDSFV